MSFVKELGKGHCFHQDQIYTRLGSIFLEQTVAIKSKQNYRRFWEKLPQLGGRFYAVHDRHRKVQNNQVGVDLFCSFDTFSAVLRLSA